MLSERFFSGYSGFPLYSKIVSSKFDQDLGEGTLVEGMVDISLHFSHDVTATMLVFGVSKFNLWELNSNFSGTTFYCFIISAYFLVK